MLGFSILLAGTWLMKELHSRQLYSAYIGLIILSPLIPFKWTAPRPQDVWLIIGFVILTSIAQTMVLSAYRFGQASLIAPFHYMHIVGATFFGY